ncbi:MAG: peptidylprolyl isomerase [Bacteriovoracaceae bacterium]
MKKTFTSKIAYFILSFVFLIIIASFLFSNFSDFSLGSSQEVAAVDGTPVTTREYQMALNRQIEFFSQMMGGGNIDPKQLEALGIKQTVLNGLIQQKLILNASKEMGMIVSLEEIKNEIKTLPYFQTTNKFDVNLYRNILQSNGYTPGQFEELVGSDLKQKKMEELFQATIVSPVYTKDIIRFKNDKLVVSAVKIPRQSLAPLVSVSEDEVKAYIADAANLKTLQSVYEENLSQYNKPEQVKARHILVTGQDEAALEKINKIKKSVTTKNFAQIASKETQDPTGKSNGGELGWFSRGRMVPEFDDAAFKLAKGTISEPVKTSFGYHIIYVEDKQTAEVKTLDQVKPELARLALQKTKAQDLDKLLKETEAKISGQLLNNDLKDIEANAKKLDMQFFKSVEVNKFDQLIGSLSLSPTEADQLFTTAEGQVVNFGNPGTIYLVKIISKSANSALESKIAEQVKTEQVNQNQTFGRRLRDELVKTMRDKSKVVTNPALM